MSNFTQTALPTTTTTPEPTTPELTTPEPATTTETTTSYPDPIDYAPTGYKFPYPLVIIAVAWTLLALCYAIAKYRQRPKNLYIIPRVFVLCSPRTVQFHYELILRVGLPSGDFNPEKHDIDITVHGVQKNEVVPMTRLNTKTLLDEPLITSLSIIVYRLVELPSLGYLVLKHSGPMKAWLYVYDFTVIDLSTNKEQYCTLNQYIGSLNHHYQLEDSSQNVHYPIDDVPLPPWSTDDIYLVLFTLLNSVMLSLTLLPLNCSFSSGIGSTLLAAIHGGCVVFFLAWLLHFYSRWDTDRKEYFNMEGSRFAPSNSVLKIIVIALSTLVGASTIYFAVSIVYWRETLVWALATLLACSLVIVCWILARRLELGQSIVALGLRLRGIEMESVGMRHSDMVADMRTKSGSTSDDGINSTQSVARGLGPRSSIKSFGFDPLTGHPSRRVTSRTPFSRLSQASGAHDSRIQNALTPPQHLAVPPSVKQHVHHAGHPKHADHPSTGNAQPGEKSSSLRKKQHKKEESLQQQHHHQQQQPSAPAISHSKHATAAGQQHEQATTSSGSGGSHEKHQKSDSLSSAGRRAAQTKKD